MANERLRTALTRRHWDVPGFAEAVGVDPKTIERWVTKGRTPHRGTAMKAARLLGEDPEYLWPDVGRRVAVDQKHGEVITVYTERSAVPNSLWLSLLQDATHSVDILVYAGLHLPEANPAWAKEIRRKCDESVKVRIAFGDPECAEVRMRGEEEGVGAGMAARIKYALAWHQSIIGCENLSIGFHSTVLYNSILRFDDQMLVNPHIYSMPAFRAPIIHLRRIEGGPLFQTYGECFEHIWSNCRPLGTKE
ncbi:helix-turn-helix transcriptional regulator [Frankia sp. Cas4]|uniref:helix-turn-helix domain-containing protein n=1 Tax=Frankia sp. Cas4 TaxID=3073927 RepID=UPI002AD43631|nr:helix-turn-helix transcriptional regulator [Frankia sp. Cas4]